MSRLHAVSTLMVLSALALAPLGLRGAAPAATPGAAPGRAAVSKERQALVERGHHLAEVSGCGDCHTPGTLFGAPDRSRALSGSELGWRGPWGTTYARNLTPDLETGLGYYQAEEIARAIRGGRRLDGQPMLPPMPWQDYAGYDDADLLAIGAYLLSLPPVSHKVPDRLPPGVTPTGSFLTFPEPSAWDAPRPQAADSTARR